MPAGPAPTTATRSGGAEPGEDTTGILPSAATPGTRSLTGDVAVELVLDVLGERDPPRGCQRRSLADGPRAGGCAGAGQPTVEFGEGAVRGNGAGDLSPLLAAR